MQTRFVTKQEFFNTVFRSVKADGFRHSFERIEEKPDGTKVNIGCAYRGVDGAKCIIGHGFSDAEVEYVRERQRCREGFGGEMFMLYGVIKFSDLDLEESRYFMIRLQGVHDMCNLLSYEADLRRFASNEHLTVPE